MDSFDLRLQKTSAMLFDALDNIVLLWLAQSLLLTKTTTYAKSCVALDGNQTGAWSSFPDSPKMMRYRIW